MSHRQLLLKVSALYTVTHHDSVIDRTLGILRKKDNHGLAGRLLYHFTCKLGEHTRFVYNQLTSLSLWLTFRSTTCRRDKPNLEVGRRSHFGEVSSTSDRWEYRAFRTSSLTWKNWTDRTGSTQQRTKQVPYLVERAESLLSENPEEFWKSEDADRWSWSGSEDLDSD